MIFCASENEMINYKHNAIVYISASLLRIYLAVYTKISNYLIQIIHYCQILFRVISCNLFPCQLCRFVVVKKNTTEQNRSRLIYQFMCFWTFLRINYFLCLLGIEYFIWSQFHRKFIFALRYLVRIVNETKLLNKYYIE